MTPSRKKIKSGSEFDVYEHGSNEVLKIPRHPRLMNLAFGDFRRKSERDLGFLQTYFPDFLPATEIVNLREGWGIRQQRVTGTLFFESPRMTPRARILFSRAAAIYQETRSIPDLLNPGNVLWRAETDTLFLIDTSVLDGTKKWPCGFLVSRFLARILSDTVQRWLKSGF